MFRLLRIGGLLVVLAVVAWSSWHDRQRSTRWSEPLYVAIYPIAADDSPSTTRYVASLDAAAFQPIDRFFSREGERHHLGRTDPVKTRLRAPLALRPPERDAAAGPLGTAWWSLRLRLWAWRTGGGAGGPEDVRVYVLYHDPELTPTVPHSLGLAKGLIGVVYAFADRRMSGANDVVIAHETLHTLGATDKYDAANDAPRFPDGYGNPLQKPLYPQRTAELMAGRRMLAPDRWAQPDDLDEVVIGPATALEIRWPAAGA